MATNLSAQIDSSLKRDLQKIAKDERRSLSNLVSLFLARGVSTYREKQTPSNGKGRAA